MSNRKVVLFAPGNYDPDALSLDSGLRCEDPSLTVQADAIEANIQTIVERYHLTGEIPVSRRTPFPSGTDFDEPLTFREANDLLNEARASFLSLPATVRDSFGNDPIAFADYASAPENLGKLREWGLAPAAPPSPSPAPAGAPAA